MKIVVISDTHTKHNLLTMPQGDMLIHCGDMTNKGSIANLSNFADWLKLQDYKHKVVISGNHDFCFENANHDIAVNIIKEAGGIYLQDSGVKIDGLNIYGSPFQPWFYSWAFNLHRGPDIAAKWALIPDNTDILITHGPPASILDLVETGFGVTESAGCLDLLNKIDKLPNLKAHLFGHLHLNGGQTKVIANTTFVNAAMCDEQYKIDRKPVIIEV